jgi:hypothetical protein
MNSRCDEQSDAITTIAFVRLRVAMQLLAFHRTLSLVKKCAEQRLTRLPRSGARHGNLFTRGGDLDTKGCCNQPDAGDACSFRKLRT